MATFLFWNINNKDLSDEIVSIVRDNDVDIIALAESNIPEFSLAQLLYSDAKFTFTVPLNLSNRIKLLIRYPKKSFIPVRDHKYVAIRRFHPPIGGELLLVIVHLQSKLYQSEQDQTLFSTELSSLICEAEETVNHNRTIVFGDFNMNPFEHGVIAANGLHAMMSRYIATREERSLHEKKYKYFYNPMWNLYNEFNNNPPGTYYYDSGSYINYYWHMFDQVIIRPCLLPRFDVRNIKIISSIGSNSIISNHQKPLLSDHLPLIFKVNDEMEV